MPHLQVIRPISATLGGGSLPLSVYLIVRRRKLVPQSNTPLPSHSIKLTPARYCTPACNYVI